MSGSKDVFDLEHAKESHREQLAVEESRRTLP
ncbi:hypothetical protein PIIN_11653 [Serendipita indica DSM 11827]|uniref:Uncharacterized protein n=1 Tax=Serendipita indica (strain DSM 11827) TaxID=1109443 RepID=G4U282_SERID|nr:hypothetical protein PIIN_11653 [Serendipita indica DSM 11827]